MTQLLKIKGIIENAGGRPIITAVKQSPLLMIDSRRYNFANDESLASFNAIGSLSLEYLENRKTSSAVSAAIFKKESFNFFNFGATQSSLTSSFPAISMPITVVIAYRMNSLGASGITYIYRMGGTSATSISFSSTGGQYLNWQGSAGGTAHRRDVDNLGEWVVEVHYWNGPSSVIVDKNGIHNVNLTDAEVKATNLTISGTGGTPSSNDFDLSYLTCYTGEMSSDDLQNLFIEAKNNFNLV